ncbi:MAG: hypothetical protein M0P31_17815 [Solirubrobacteraceae bacterium]|nr:hypothetical protein [Solirubrobacteraceae bacterium]
MVDRRAAAANALASVRVEGLEPGADVEALMLARAAGEVSQRQWDAAKRAVLRGESVDAFVPALTR